MKFEIELEQNDFLITNDRQWEVLEDGGGIEAGFVTLESPVVGKRSFTREDLEDLIRHSGMIKIYREGYQDLDS